MTSKAKHFSMTFLFASVLFMAITTLIGCKKSQPTPPQEPNTAQLAPASTEQTTCPVMGGAIDKAIFTEYQGKKVYFCCPTCKLEFEKNPEKYIAKLPQFKQ